MAKVVIDRLCKSYGSVEILRDISLSVAEGEFVVLVGPSGCGKTTLLRLIAGLDTATSGDLYIGGRRVNDLPPAARKIAMVFQSYALYPHKNVRDNMVFGLRFTGMPRDEIDRRVAEAARMLRLDELLARKPRDLSGGQRQRVAIGRAIVRHPDVFLFDEPLSNLDAALRVSTRVEIARLHRLIGATMIYVTHDQTEAMTLADRLVVMNKGRVEQVGAPLDLYYQPANLFVAGFIGSPRINLLPGVVSARDGGGATVALAGGGEFVVAGAPALAPGDNVTLGLRPEHLTLAADATPPAAFTLTACIEHVERLGEQSWLHATGAGGAALIIEHRGPNTPAPGATVRVAARTSDMHVFDATGVRVETATA